MSVLKPRIKYVQRLSLLVASWEARKLLVATALSAVFTAALLHATLEGVRVLDRSLRTIFPDWGALWELEKVRETVKQLRPVGYAALAATLALVAAGFLMRKRYLSATGALALYLPTFGYFAFAMFFLAGVGVLRTLWLPLMDISPDALRLGNVVYVPYIAAQLLATLAATAIGVPPSAFDISVPLAFIAMGTGTLVFLLGTLTWLYGKFTGAEF
ncbi:TPA: hypothetical protein EYP38_02720, partial [Candidatus Micrarchaeota archaeon]|nr:hypothetical protein [Candidatus Micrarchaeota archaeon]